MFSTTVWLWTALAVVGWCGLMFLLGDGQLLGPAQKRTVKLPKDQERVLVLGASSGIGKELALKYAARGARICLVARREDALAAVVAECKAILLASPSSSAGVKTTVRTQEDVDKMVIGVVGSVSEVEDMVRARGEVEKAFGGVDTMLIVAGVSATRPFLSIAGSSMSLRDGPTSLESPNPIARVRAGETGREGIEKVVESAQKAMETNYVGPLVAYATFLPLLSTSSPSPSILLIASVACLVPAPTRSLYASTKAAALSLHQCIAMESEVLGLGVRFLSILPGTVATDLRSKAVDTAPTTSAPKALDAKWSKLTLSPAYVVSRIISALDAGGSESEEIFLPAWPYRAAHLAFYLPWARRLVERGAIGKYKGGME